LSRGSFATPGDFFLYSTANSHFLSHLIASSTGMATGDFANDYLFKPLGINFSRLPNPINYISWYNYYVSLGKTTWQQDVQGYEIGGMGLYLTAREMAKLGFLYINKGIWNGLRILSEDYIDEATKPYVAANYGYQWWISSQCYRYFLALGMGGQIIAIVPSLDMIIVIKCQPLNPENQNIRMYYMEQSIPMIIDSANRVE
jgi:CubicO group peptidase (beta-lactamase class C family)